MFSRFAFLLILIFVNREIRKLLFVTRGLKVFGDP